MSVYSYKVLTLASGVRIVVLTLASGYCVLMPGSEEDPEAVSVLWTGLGSEQCRRLVWSLNEFKGLFWGLN